MVLQAAMEVPTWAGLLAPGQVPSYPSDLTDAQWAELEPSARAVMAKLTVTGRPIVHDLRHARRDDQWSAYGMSGGHGRWTSHGGKRCMRSMRRSGREAAVSSMAARR